jgi:hypothetical protein
VLSSGDNASNGSWTSHRRGIRQDLLSAEVAAELVNAARPLTLGELSSRLGQHFRSLAYVLAADCREGTIERLEGGRYCLLRAPGMEDILQFVLVCELRWRLDDRLELMRGRPDGSQAPRRPD